MRKNILLGILVLTFSCGIVTAQTTYTWAGTCDGNWKQGAGCVRWNPGGLWDQPGFGILYFNDNSQLTMTNNVPGTYSQHKITFGSGNTLSRTISGNAVQLFDNGGTWPWVKNESSALHTIGFPLTASNTSGINLELLANEGPLAFTNTIDNLGRTIQIYGNNSATDGTNRYIRLTGVLSGSGALNV